MEKNWTYDDIEDNLVKAYENYRKAVREFTTVSGLSFELHQVIRSGEKDADYRNVIVGKLSEIDLKYND